MNPQTWAILRKSNFDHEDHRGDQWFAARDIPREALAKLMCDALNAAEFEHSDAYFEVVPNDHVKQPDWEP